MCPRGIRKCEVGHTTKMELYKRRIGLIADDFRVRSSNFLTILSWLFQMSLKLLAMALQAASATNSWITGASSFELDSFDSIHEWGGPSFANTSSRRWGGWKGLCNLLNQSVPRRQVRDCSQERLGRRINLSWRKVFGARIRGHSCRDQVCHTCSAPKCKFDPFLRPIRLECNPRTRYGNRELLWGSNSPNRDANQREDARWLLRDLSRDAKAQFSIGAFTPGEYVPFITSSKDVRDTNGYFSLVISRSCGSERFWCDAF